MTRMTRARRAVQAVLLALLSTPLSSAQKCYYPDKSESRYDVPCSDEEGSACCGENSICLSNGYCLDQDQPFAVSRGSCTDQDWKSSNCPQRCQTCYADGGCAVVVYKLFADGTQYCCGYVSIDTSTNELSCAFEDPFTLPDGEIILGRAVLADVSNSTSNSSTASGSSAQATSSASSNDETTTGNDNQQYSNKNNDSSHDVAIGAGVGIPLGIIAISSIIWALWERRGKQKMQQSIKHQGWDESQQKWDFGPVHHHPPVELSNDGRPVELAQ